MNIDIYNIVIIQTILFVVSLFVILFKSYFKKKGENIATKEDIGFITSEIEIIKNEISFKNKKKTDFFFERKKNIIDFFDFYFIWTSRSLSVIDYIISHGSDKKILRELISQLKSDQIKVFTHFTRIFLYDANSDFTKGLNKIYNETIILHNTTLSFLLTFENLAIQHELLSERAKGGKLGGKEDKIRSEFDKFKKHRDLELEKFLDESSGLNKQLSKNKLLIVKIVRKEIKIGYA